MKNIKNFLSRNVFSILIIVLLIIPLFDLFHPGLPLTHDGQDHVARIANFYQNLREGNAIPRWAANLNWGYGHPILMFLYPFPSYFASLFHLLGFSFVDSVKIVFGLSFILSGLSMFLWLRLFLSSHAAMTGGLLYAFAPYRFVDLYVRGAIGEHVAFIFPPLVLYFLFKLSKKYSYKYVLGGSLSLAGLILSHNAISLMFLPIIFIYALFLFWQIKWKKHFLLSALFIIILGFGLSSFFWMPAFLEGKYTLRDIVTGNEALNRFVGFNDLLYGPWRYGSIGAGQFTVQVGILHWLFVIISIPLVFVYYKRKNKNWIMVSTFIALFFFTLFIMTDSAKNVWQTITILQKFQFPWRFLSLSVFLSAVLGAFVIYILPKKFATIITFIIIVLLLFSTQNMWKANGFLQKPEGFYTDIYNGTTDTGESAPIWSVRFMEKRAKASIEVIDGKADIEPTERITTKHEYTVNSFGNSRLRENTLYFPGWKVLVDGNEVPMQFQDPNNRGLMTFFVENGSHKVSIELKETKLRFISNAISIGSLFVLFSLVILKDRKIW